MAPSVSFGRLFPKSRRWCQWMVVVVVVVAVVVGNGSIVVAVVGED
jgi:hypothetical protein